ncbi:MAG: ATP-binding protein [Bacteroidales bacterium]|nr:ATP-binding protein [Bacteroidales bacterium]
MIKKHFNPIQQKSGEIIEFLMSSPDMPKDDNLLFKIRLSIEEAVENIVNYAYNDGVGWMEVGTDLENTGLILSVTLKDAGIHFKPLAKPDPDLSLPVEQREIGGLGIYLCKKLMDDVIYHYEDGCNILTMKKKIAQE